MKVQLPSWLISAERFTAAVGGPTRSDTFEVHVEIEDYTNPNHPMVDCGVWDKRTGGDADSTASTYQPGGMVAKVGLGGTNDDANVVVSRLYRLVRDHQDLAPKLKAGRGKARMIVKQQPLDLDGNVFGDPLVWQGVMKRATFPETDSTSQDAALVELEMVVDSGGVST